MSGLPELELFLKYVGHGLKCMKCGRVRETTRINLRQGDETLQEFRICDACLNKGVVIKFTPKTVESRRQKLRSKKDRKRRVSLSRQKEKALAADVGGEVQPGSGNMKGAGADVRRVGEWRLEHKFTDSKSGFRVTVDMLDAVIRHGNMAQEWPGLVFNFNKLNRSFVTLPYEVFLELVERVRET